MRIPFPAVSFGLLAMLCVQCVQAGSCPSSQRVPVRNAGCLDAGVVEKTSRLRTLWAHNKCADIAEVGVKFDLIEAPDVVFHMGKRSEGGRTRRSKVTYELVRGVYCCRDKGICNRSEYRRPWAPFDFSDRFRLPLE